MAQYFQAAGGILLAVILSALLSEQGKHMSVLLGMGVSIMVLLIGAEYLEPVLSFMESLESLGNLDTNLISVLLKATGICMISEIATLVCRDSGNESMGKALQILTSLVLLWISLPLFRAVVDLLEKILEEL